MSIGIGLVDDEVDEVRSEVESSSLELSSRRDVMTFGEVSRLARRLRDFLSPSSTSMSLVPSMR